jgi:hypothetical protein
MCSLDVLTALQKVATPVKNGVQFLVNWLKRLDSGIRRNDENGGSPTPYEFIMY